MGLTFVPQTIPAIVSALMLVALIAFILTRRRSGTSLPFILLCGAAAIWCAGNALEHNSATIEGRVFWGKVQYAGSQSLPVFWFIFATLYSGHGYWLRWWRVALVALIPALTFVAVVAYPASKLVWVSYSLYDDGTFIESIIVRGPLFWISAVAIYTFVVAGIAMIGVVAFRSPTVYRMQAVTLLFGALVPLIGNMTFVFGVRPLRMDTTPVTFAIACLIFAYGLFRFRLFDVTPVAREAILDRMTEAVFVIDAQGRVVDANPAAIRLVRQPLSELLGASAARRLPFWSAIVRRLDKPTEAPETMVDEARGQAFELRVTQLTFNKGAAPGAMVILRNVTDRWRAEGALQRANQELSERVLELERRNQEIVLLAGLAEQLLSAADRDALVDTVATFGPQLFPNEAGLLALRERDRFRVAASWGGAPRVGESLADGYAGTPWLPTPNQIAVPLVDQEERIGVFAIEAMPGARHPEALRQLTTTAADLIGLALANLRLRDRLRDDSLRDALTGLFNRRYLDAAIVRELERANRSHHPLAVVMLDLDQFKSFNDRYGHAAGDSALRSFGRLLSARLRATDVACRYGGEEFTLLLPNTPLEQAARIADRLREEAEATPIVHGGESYPPLTVSAGIAIYPEDGQTAQALLDAADAALYRAKSGGRNRIMPWVALPLAGPTVRRTLPSAG